MFNTLLVLLLPILVFGAIPWRLDCSRLANGIYKYTCFSYTECIDGSIGEIKCASNEVFSKEDGLCIIPSKNKWPCSDVRECKHRGDQHYADLSSDCNTYYTCHSGHFYGHGYCPTGTVFDEKSQWCDTPDHVKSPCGTAA